MQQNLSISRRAERRLRARAEKWELLAGQMHDAHFNRMARAEVRELAREARAVRRARSQVFDPGLQPFFHAVANGTPR